MTEEDRAAVLRFLDPEDEAMMDDAGEALIEEYQRQMREAGGWNAGELMRVVVASLRKSAQGERIPE